MIVATTTANRSVRLLLLVAFQLLLTSSVLAQDPLQGNLSAVYDLLDRVLPEGGRKHFVLKLDDCCVHVEKPCFCLEDTWSGELMVTGTSASELSAGIGWYLRHYCNMTIGWPRGGGSNVFIPQKWPLIGKTPYCKRRIVPWSYLMNVCTHSYSLVWYDWSDWEQFIDWMALSGINLMLAMTGQEEIQYKVFSALGVNDIDIRSWFNGPAFLAWSRGQNEYGNNICGPLPRYWMKQQWEMQRSHILPRLRSLGITGQLPGFQGNVPIQVKNIFNDGNITQEGDTGWMDSLDPLFGKIADLWMKTLIDDFGTDHWYQLDGYFDGSTAPWMSVKHETVSKRNAVPVSHDGSMNDISDDPVAFQRGLAAYMGLNRTDPKAVWSFQGWAIVGWSTPQQAALLKGFVDATPKHKFVVIDMSTNGSGEWKQWKNASFFGADFIWTSLHNFGGTDGMKGDLAKINQIPFDAPPDTPVVGTGVSPEGIDQNPAYYEFIFDHHFRDGPIQDLHSYVIERSHRRYGLSSLNIRVVDAWSLLIDSSYANDVGVQDGTGIPHLPPGGGDGASMFKPDRFTPNIELCKIFQAWGILLEAVEEESDIAGFQQEPFVYDLVNLGREILAQIATPASFNFSDATRRNILDETELLDTGNFYIELLNDTNTLVATDKAFLLGPWIESARRWGSERNDCPSAVLNSTDCDLFFEWNARTQITTWNPVSKGSASVPGGPIDYAAKHWSGLIRDYYGVRANVVLQQALRDKGNALNQSEVNRFVAAHAYQWTTATNKYPIRTMGSPTKVSRGMHDKYKPWFESCSSDDLHLSSTKGGQWDRVPVKVFS